MIAHDMYTRYIKSQAYKWDYPFKNCMRQVGSMKKKTCLDDPSTP